MVADAAQTAPGHHYVFHTLAPSAEPSAPAATPVATPAATPLPSAVPAASPTSTPAANAQGPQLALIVDDCGQWIATERGFVALEIPLTLSVLPDVPYTGVIAREASDAGKGRDAPSADGDALRPQSRAGKSYHRDERRADRRASSKRPRGSAPRTRRQQSRGQQSLRRPRVMRAVIGVLAEHNLFFIDSKTNAASVGERNRATEWEFRPRHATSF